MKNKQGRYTQQLLSLPSINNIENISELLRYPKEIVLKYSLNNERYYHKIEMKKKMGGIRYIESPIRELKAIQRWILRNILDRLTPSAHAKGFVKNISIVDNAKPHEGKQYILNLDIKDFFTNIKASHVYAIFKSIGYSPEISFILTSICTKGGYLPQGAPTSPSLSNLVCLRMDFRISSYCRKRALTYTRYADDISVSGNKLLIIKKASTMIKKIIENEGYPINNRKTKLLGPKIRREVTGLSVNPKVTISKEKYLIYRKRIYDLVRKEDLYSLNVINGILSFVKSVDPVKSKKLNLFYEKQKTKIL